MILKAKDIISFKVNWNEKYKNLIELSNSFMYFDEKISQNTIDVEDDSLWPDQIKNHLLTSLYNIGWLANLR